MSGQKPEILQKSRKLRGNSPKNGHAHNLGVRVWPTSPLSNSTKLGNNLGNYILHKLAELLLGFLDYSSHTSMETSFFTVSMATKAKFSKFQKSNSASLWRRPLCPILPNLAWFETGEAGQTSTPRTIVFYWRHILDGSIIAVRHITRCHCLIKLLLRYLKPPS